MLQDHKGKKHQIEHAYEVSGWGCWLSRVRNNMHPDGAAGSHWWGTSDRTCLQLSGRCCRISRVGKYRSYMHTRHQEGTSGSHGIETPDRTCLLGVRTALHDLTGSEHKIVHAYKVSGGGCKISRVRNTR